VERGIFRPTIRPELIRKRRAAKVAVSDNEDLVSVTQAPTDYFTREEYARLLDATYLYRVIKGESIGGPHGTRIRTLIMLICCLEFWVDHGQTET